MKIPELRTAQHLISPNKDYSKFHEAVVDEKGNCVGVFFGPYAKLLAEYATSWTDVMKLAQAQVKAEDQKVAPVETVTP